MSRKDQLSLLGDSDGTIWGDEWQDMPEFVQEDLAPAYQVIVSFENESDLAEFSKLLDQKITPTTRSIWFPKSEIGQMVNKRFRHES